MADLARLVVRLEADNARLQKDLDKARTQINKYKSDVASSVKGIGAGIGKLAAVAGVTLTVGGLAALVKHAIDAADEMSLLAQKTGITTEALSQLNYAAKLSGVEDLGDSLIKFNKTISEAATGGKEQAQAFADLGISIKGANGELRPTEELLTAVADKFSQYADSASKTALAQKLFGKSGAELIPLLNQGADGLARFREESDKTGNTISTKTANAANDFNDALDRLKRSIEGGFNIIAQDLTPAMQDFADLVSSPEFISGLSSVAQGIASIAHSAATGISYVGEFGKALGFLASKAAGAEELPFENKIEDLQAAIKNTQSQISSGKFLHLDTSANEKALESLQEQLTATIRLQEQFQKNYGGFGDTPAPASAPAPAAAKTKPTLVTHDASAIQDAANEAKALAKAQTEAIQAVTQAQAEAARQSLDNDLADNLKKYSDYYAERLKIEQDAIDQEIAAREKEKAGASAADQVKLQGEIDALRIKRDAAEAQSAHDREQAEKDLADKVFDLQQKLLEDTGNVAQARKEAIEKEFGDLIANLTVQGDHAGVAIAVKLEGIEKAKADFDALEEQLQESRDAYARKQQEIDLAVQTGLKSRVQAQRDEEEAAKEAAAAQTVIADQLEKSANAIGDPRKIEQVKQLRTEIAKTGEVADRTFLQIKGSVEDNFTTAFDEILNGTKSVGAAFKDLLAGIVRDMNHLIAQRLSEQLVDSLFGGLKGGGGTSGGGFNLGSIFGSIFGGSGNSGAISAPPSGTSSGSGIGEWFSTAVSVLGSMFGGAREVGGSMASGGVFLVGENGPELVRPNFNATVVPAPRTAEILSAMPHRASGGFMAANQPFVGGEFGPELVMRHQPTAKASNDDQRAVTVHQNIVIDAPQGTVSSATQAQVAAKAARGVRIAAQRNN